MWIHGLGCLRSPPVRGTTVGGTAVVAGVATCELSVDDVVASTVLHPTERDYFQFSFRLGCVYHIRFLTTSKEDIRKTFLLSGTPFEGRNATEPNKSFPVICVIKTGGFFHGLTTGIMLPSMPNFMPFAHFDGVNFRGFYARRSTIFSVKKSACDNDDSEGVYGRGSCWIQGW